MTPAASTSERPPTPSQIPDETPAEPLAGGVGLTSLAAALTRLGGGAGLASAALTWRSPKS
jgi:hypothetical protein